MGSKTERTLFVRRIIIQSCFVILAIATLMVGCGIHRWDSTPSLNIRGTNATAGVSGFIAAYGWNSYTNDEDLYRWEDLQSHYIQDLPWTRYKNQQFPAPTHDGILYVLSKPGWHHDYGGVANNPQTNHFPMFVDGFKPIGDHWHVWCIVELSGGSHLPKLYE